MKIGLVSYRFVINNLHENIKQIERALKEVNGSVDLLVFGETFLQGFSGLSYKFGLDKDIAITTNSKIFKDIKKLSSTYNTDILLGYYELADEKIYSSCALIEKGELTYNYRRITPNWHPQDADMHYACGTSPSVLKYHGKDISVALCGDLWIDPDLFKTDGLVIWPVYLNFDLETWKSEEQAYLKQAMKVANEVVMVNSLSNYPKSYGNSFYFKDNEIKDSIGYDKEDILIIEC